MFRQVDNPGNFSLGRGWLEALQRFVPTGSFQTQEDLARLVGGVGLVGCVKRKGFPALGVLNTDGLIWGNHTLTVARVAIVEELALPVSHIGFSVLVGFTS